VYRVIISHTVESDDENYQTDNLTGNGIEGISAYLSDNDVAEVTVSETTVEVSEAGGMGTYTIVLTNPPIAHHT